MSNIKLNIASALFKYQYRVLPNQVRSKIYIYLNIFTTLLLHLSLLPRVRWIQLKRPINFRIVVSLPKASMILG